MNIEQFKVCCFTWNFVFLVKGMLHETFYQFCHVQRQRRLVLKIVQTFLSSWHSIMRKNECTSNFFVKCKCNFFFTGWWKEKGVMKVQGAWKVYDLYSDNVKVSTAVFVFWQLNLLQLYFWFPFVLTRKNYF